MEIPEEIYYRYYFVPPEVLKEMQNCAPPALMIPMFQLRRIIEILAVNTLENNREYSIYGDPYWWMYIKDVAQQYSKAEGVEISPIKIAHILARIGLRRHRRNNGTLVIWTQKQIEILHRYFSTRK
jgi:hypothetical protein